MRQHITIADVETLSERAKGKLRQWGELQRGDWVVVYQRGKEPLEAIVEYKDNTNGFMVSSRLVAGYKKLNHLLPLLTIGQMIEFLDEHDIVVDITELWQHNKISNLYDHLWKAVKEVLEGEK